MYYWVIVFYHRNQSDILAARMFKMVLSGNGVDGALTAEKAVFKSTSPSSTTPVASAGGDGCVGATGLDSMARSRESILLISISISISIGLFDGPQALSKNK